MYSLQELSDRLEIQDLVFHPGFSTKEEVSEKIAVVTKELDGKPIMVVAVDGAFA